MKIAAAIFTALLATASLAQEHPTVTAQTNSVYVGADGKFESAPDTAQIQFSVSVQEDTSQAAYQLDPKAASIGFFSVQPMIDYRKPTQRVVGYRVTTNVTLKLKDFSKVGPITQQLADANVSETQTLNYTLENIDEAKNKAVEDAYRRARNSAETIAHASGRTLGDLSYASVDTFETPRIFAPRMDKRMSAMAAAAPAAHTEEFTPQTVDVTAHVNALFNLK
jgi:uncharacterized protein YggE